MNNVHRNLIRPHSFMSVEKDIPSYNGHLPVPPFFQNFISPFSNNQNLSYFSIPPPNLLFNATDPCGLLGGKKLPFSTDSGMIPPPSSDIMKLPPMNHSNSVLSKLSANFFPFPSLSNSPFPPSAFVTGNYNRFSNYDPCGRFLSAALASRHAASINQKLCESSKDVIDPFQKGRKIKMSDGELKMIESLSVSDFENSCKSHSSMTLVASEVKLIEVSHSDNTARVQLIHENKSNVIVVSVTKPFFTRNSGWAAIDPEACMTKHNLFVAKLQLNDICFCLVKKKSPIDENNSQINAQNIKRPISEKLRKKSRYQPY